ncbi:MULTISPECIES: FbpB family small basic protein [unclassified Virgibacillus]|nr:FbpB family small basic protein [Virgibacillus sp. LDC-1]
MSLKRKLSFDDLVKANRQQILKDKEIMDRIEENIEQRIQDSLNITDKEA